MTKITISEVNKRNLRVIGFLVSSWAVSLGLVYITGDERLVGLAPVLNFVAVLIQKELANDGYLQARK